MLTYLSAYLQNRAAAFISKGAYLQTKYTKLSELKYLESVYSVGVSMLGC